MLFSSLTPSVTRSFAGLQNHCFSQSVAHSGPCFFVSLVRYLAGGHTCLLIQSFPSLICSLSCHAPDHSLSLLLNHSFHSLAQSFTMLLTASLTRPLYCYLLCSVDFVLNHMMFGLQAKHQALLELGAQKVPDPLLLLVVLQVGAVKLLRWPCRS